MGRTGNDGVGVNDQTLMESSDAPLSSGATANLIIKSEGSRSLKILKLTAIMYSLASEEIKSGNGFTLYDLKRIRFCSTRFQTSRLEPSVTSNQ